MSFEEILERYENDINYANRMLKPESLSFFKKTVDYWKGYKRASFKWFQDMKLELNFIPETQKLIKEESHEYIYVDEFNNYYFPYKLLLYRQEKIPVYSDDYGQQDFIVYKGKAFYGGPYNFCADNDFCSFVDTIKDDIE
jgi:hypothetical protein